MDIFQRLHRRDWTRSERSLKQTISIPNINPLAWKMCKYFCIRPKKDILQLRVVVHLRLRFLVSAFQLEH